MIISDITKYSYNDLTLVPAKVSNVNSRSECILNSLPIFASCMSTVISENNYDYFEENGITPIIPRNIPYEIRYNCILNEKWVALSLKEFVDIFIVHSEKLPNYRTYNVCIDIANGHMHSLFEVCVQAKILAKNYNLVIMTGNIANPETYKYLCTEVSYNKDGEAFTAIDYIRLGIGAGSQCTTTSNVAVHYPIASLIDECNNIRKYMINKNLCPQIVADGGIRNYDHVIKALALGADYVMIGGLFAGFYESASPLLIKNEDGTFSEVDYKYESEEKKRKDIKNRQLYKECYGMSTKKAQSLIGKSSKTAEGKHSMIKVEYTLKQWVENMESYLRSAMSYCDCKRLVEFIGNQQLVVNSSGTLTYINK